MFLTVDVRRRKGCGAHAKLTRRAAEFRAALFAALGIRRRVFVEAWRFR
jgi:hypothetical protein